MLVHVTPITFRLSAVYLYNNVSFLRLNAIIRKQHGAKQKPTIRLFIGDQALRMRRTQE